MRVEWGVDSIGMQGGGKVFLILRVFAFFLAGALLVVLIHQLLPLSKASISKPVLSAETSNHNEPWGDVRITSFVLNRPEDYFSGPMPAAAPVRWLFGGQSPAEVRAFLESCELGSEAKAKLLDERNWYAAPEGVWITPELEVVVGLSEKARTRLYNHLARTRENLAQRYPFVCPMDGPSTWLAQTGLSQEKVQAVERTFFKRQNAWCFADAMVFYQMWPSNDVIRLVKAISRIPTVSMAVHIENPGDVEVLMRYWNTAGQAGRLRSLLDSLARVPGGTTLDVADFLPPLPRRLLYTYPEPNRVQTGKPVDCFWTAMNFFNTQPDDRFLDPKHTMEVLNRDYQMVPKADAFGDVILLYEPGEPALAVHMCVYLAADVVFTKNGADIFQPWILMKLPDMMAQFPSETPQKVAVFRRIRKGI